jgi:hypothetical protein
MAIKPRIVLEKQISKPGFGDLFALKKVNAIQNIIWGDQCDLEA